MGSYLLSTILFLSVFLFTPKPIHSQNIINNPSFDTPNPCPSSSGNGELNRCLGWNSWSGSVDYYNTCTTTIPNNQWGSQNTATGAGMAACLTYYTGFQFREYGGTNLTVAMTPGSTYYLQFKASRCDQVQYASNNVGIQFTTAASVTTNNIAHLRATSVLTDQVGWTVVTGSFVPAVAYSFVAFGNFYDDASTSRTLMCGGCGNTWAHYYMDDLCASRNPADCNVPLAVDFIRPEAKPLANKNVQLKWAVNENDKIAYFNVERFSSENPVAKVVNKIESNSNPSLQTYQVIDQHSEMCPLVYYTLTAYGYNGEQLNATTLEVSYLNPIQLIVAPNPAIASHPIRLYWGNLFSEVQSIRIMDMNGKLVKTIQPETQDAHSQELQLQDLPQGIYTLQLLTESQMYSHKFVIAD